MAPEILPGALEKLSSVGDGRILSMVNRHKDIAALALALYGVEAGGQEPVREKKPATEIIESALQQDIGQLVKDIQHARTPAGQEDGTAEQIDALRADLVQKLINLSFEQNLLDIGHDNFDIRQASEKAAIRQYMSIVKRGDIEKSDEAAAILSAMHANDLETRLRARTVQARALSQYAEKQVRGKPLSFSDAERTEVASMSIGRFLRFAAEKYGFTVHDERLSDDLTTMPLPKNIDLEGRHLWEIICTLHKNYGIGIDIDRSRNGCLHFLNQEQEDAERIDNRETYISSNGTILARVRTGQCSGNDAMLSILSGNVDVASFRIRGGQVHHQIKNTGTGRPIYGNLQYVANSAAGLHFYLPDQNHHRNESLDMQIDICYFVPNRPEIGMHQETLRLNFGKIHLCNGDDIPPPPPDSTP